MSNIIELCDRSIHYKDKQEIIISSYKVATNLHAQEV